MSDFPQFVFPADRVLDVVDSHTCGQPTRVIVAGADIASGMDPDEARALMARDRDWVRRVAVFEPRGHRSMFVAALIAPADGERDFGVVFMDANGYPDMCGHASIGTATTLCELGLVAPEQSDYSGDLHFGLRTPAGRLALRATFENGRCEAVAFQSPLAYHIGGLDLLLGETKARVEIAYGGQWYAFVPVEAAGLTIEADAIDALIAAAGPVRHAIAEQSTLVDPRTGIPPLVGNIVWTAAPRDPQAAALNVPVSSSNSFDRSPCGTATCARMATLVATGDLAIGETFVNEGVMGTLYNGVAVAPAKGPEGGIVPEVQGRAWITSSARLRVDARDPLGEGYLIGNGPAER